MPCKVDSWARRRPGAASRDGVSALRDFTPFQAPNAVLPFEP
jgi:hypothetical protein